ncbi:MAG: SGNH/GDSL hydrolase family protein [Lachnospiraceae bacterium]|nr:SGNH/GDSL hydrolase family protein [Lachnospiraceae bacterium]
MINWNSVAYKGDISPLRKFIDRAEKGETLTVGFIGGSITNGSLASIHENCYAAKTVEGLRKKYPTAEFKYINAGIGGTTSHFGVARCEEDLLRFKPDLVITEFSVNDENTVFYRETYEGLIRRILQSSSRPAVIILHNVFYDSGSNAQDQHELVGYNYGIPCISVKTSIYRDVVCGLIPVRSVTPDDLHPNDKGHELVSRLLLDFINAVADGEIDSACQNEAGRLQRPITENCYENAMRVIKPDKIKTSGEAFTAKVASDTVSKPYGVDPAFAGVKKGDFAEFKVNGSEIAAQFVRFVKHPACVAKAVIDGDEEHAVILDGNFDETWGDKLDIKILSYHGKKGVHQVRIEVIEGDEKAVPFDLVSLIVAGE